MSKSLKEVADSVAKLINPDSKGIEASQASATCTLCPGPAHTFTDALSAREYTISGMCQVCQDETFGPPDEDPIISPKEMVQLLESAE